jgi:2'-5' RNA ligase
LVFRILNLFRISSFGFPDAIEAHFISTLPRMPRCFVAVTLSDETKDRLVAAQPPAAPGLRILGREELHLTLHFFGEIGIEEFDAVRKALAGVKSNRFIIDIRGVGRFPPRGKATVLWAGVVENPLLDALHASVGAALAEAIRFQPETRPYAPHITLARVNFSAHFGPIDRYLQEQRDFQVPSVLVDRLVLFSSVLAKSSPQYREEAVYPL